MTKQKKQGKIYIVVGGQYGSESKGQFTNYLCHNTKAKYIVRTGSVNAGHTVLYRGKFYKNQQIPVGWTNPNIKLIIGAGAYISPEILEQEIHMIEKATGKSIKDRLFIDHRAGSQLPAHREAEAGLHARMGSTGEGVSAAIIEKMKRDFDYCSFQKTNYAKKYDKKKFTICDTVDLLNKAYDRGCEIVIEGTQGNLLDMHLGYHPYVTSRQTTATNWLTEAGFSPNLNTEIALICRTHPIRVAGNSGPMPNEIDWVSLIRRINRKRQICNLDILVSEASLEALEGAIEEARVIACLPSGLPHEWSDKDKQTHSAELVELHKNALNSLPDETLTELLKVLETTTVTKKLRRIAQIDYGELKYAVKINRPDYVVMNFMNYSFPTLFHSHSNIEQSLEYGNICKFITKTEEKLDTPVRYINYTPYKVVEIEKSGKEYVTKD